MTHETPTLTAESRERTGTRYSNRLRKAGKLPVVIYGHGQEPQHLAVDGETFVERLLGGAHLFELKIDSGKTETCLVKDLQYDFLGDHIIHADLARVDLNEEVHVAVPILIKGQDKSPGCKAAGAIFEHPMTDLEVACKANAIPEEVVVDVSELEANSSITASQVELPAGVALVTDGDAVVAMVHVKKEEEEVEETPAESAAGAEPEVITERKEEEAGE